MITIEQAEAEPLEFLGRDIALFEEDIKFGTSNDFSFIIFRDNLGQAVKIRLLTALGELRNHPNYGSSLSESLQETFTRESLNKIKDSIRAALLQDPRVDVIRNIQIDVLDTLTQRNGVQGNAIQVRLEIKPVLQKNNLNLIFDLFQ